MISKIKKCFIKILSNYLNLNLTKKVIFGYVFVVFIPSVTLGLFVYAQYVNEMRNKYIERKQQLIEQSVHYLQYDLMRVSGSYKLFQTNSNFIEYLSAYPLDVGEYVYSYLKYIRPLSNYLYASVPFVSDVKIYTNNPDVFTVGTEIIDQSEASDLPEELDNIIPPNGIWRATSTDISVLPQYTYYQNIYDNNYYKKLGVMAVSVNSGLIKNFLGTLNYNEQDSSSIYLITDDRSILFQSVKNGLSLSQEDVMRYVSEFSPNFYKIINLNGRHVNLNVMKISELNEYLVLIEDTGIVFKGEYKKITMLVAILIVLLFVLTAIYYMFSLNITTRVSKLAHHMKSVGEDNLAEFSGNTSKDEIGYLISSYNSMIRRIKDLIIKVQQEEIMRREAAYRALQAQIKPHFLYGTLETIRMLAKTNNDNEVEEIAFSLGKVMRYALATSDHVFLKNEIDNVRAYLQIYKARLEENLQFSIENDDPSVINDFPCPQFILQPIVENSIKHGIRKISGIGIIRLKITDEGRYILITVEDNGIGITSERLQCINRMLEDDLDINDFKMDSGGFALYNIKERIKSFYGNESCIKLQSWQGRGTICTLKLMKK